MSDIPNPPAVPPLPAPPAPPAPPNAHLLRDLPTLPIVPQASGLVFGWCVTSASYDLEPKIVKAQFGDGYAQRRPAGINTQARMWNVDMKNIDTKTANDVLAFLEARNGVEVFNWTPPRTTTEQSVLAPSWNFSYGDMIDNGDRLYNISVKFEQAFV
jgi:phage-related protein